MNYVKLKYYSYSTYWEKHTLEIRSADEAVHAIEQLAGSTYRNLAQPILVFFDNHRGEEFALGIGGDMSTVILIRDGENFYYSIGDPNRDGTAVFLSPTWTEMSAKQLIPYSQAEKALRVWLSGGDVASVVPLTEYLP